MINIEINDREVLDALEGLVRRLGNMTPAMQDIGELLAESTIQRFSDGVGPGGEAWKENSPATILAYVDKYKGSRSKRGGLTKKGQARAGSKKPLIGETKSLSTMIHYSAGRDRVEIGSPQVYAAVQQFGAKRGQFGAAPWGDIPARPFLGVSDSDKGSILAIVSGYMLP